MLLAQANEPSVATPAPPSQWAHPAVPSHWPAQRDLLTFCHTIGPAEAAGLVVIGVIYLMWGVKIYKWLIMVNAAILGLAIGWVLGTKFNAAPITACMGAIVFGALAWRTMKYAVAVLGGIVGAVVGASAWHGADLPPDLAWAGAMSGLILFGLLSFLVFTGCIMLYLSLQGAMMLVLGVIGVASKYEDISPRILKLISTQPYLLPMAVAIPCIIGLVHQHHRHSGSAAGASPAPAAPKKK